jgi:hypothetical protein
MGSSEANRLDLRQDPLRNHETEYAAGGAANQLLPPQAVRIPSWFLIAKKQASSLTIGIVLLTMGGGLVLRCGGILSRVGILEEPRGPVVFELGEVRGELGLKEDWSPRVARTKSPLGPPLRQATLKGTVRWPLRK